jgi:hypothetical protein
MDFHIHSCLSPCGSLEMGPKNVINSLKKNNISISSITDHNSIFNFPSFFINGIKNKILFFPGIEIQTLEEIHIIVIFPTFLEAINFYKKIEQFINNIKADYDIFGDQPIVDEEENIIKEEEKLLIQSINLSIDDIVKEANKLNLIYFPAHIFDDSFSIISQIGFIPDNIEIPIIEISQKNQIEKIDKIKKKFSIITNSDAHYLNQIGKKYFSIKNNTQLDYLINSFYDISSNLKNEKIFYQEIFDLSFYKKNNNLKEKIKEIYLEIKNTIINYPQNIENIFL